VQYGFGRLSYTLMEHGLLDELRLWVYPLFVGSSGPQDLLYRDCPLTKLHLIDVKPLKDGVVILSYQFEPTNAESQS
jgi:riboflavin biosynthesis pyrimidine reductase